MNYLVPSVLKKSNTNRLIYCHVHNLVAFVPKNETQLVISQGRELWRMGRTRGECAGVISMGSCVAECQLARGAHCLGSLDQTTLGDAEAAFDESRKGETASAILLEWLGDKELY